MIDDNFDDFLSRSLKSSQIEVDTNIDEVQEKILGKWHESHSRKLRRQRAIKLSSVALALIIAVSSFLVFPQSVYALKGRIFNTIMHWGKEIQIRYSADQESPPLEDKLQKASSDIQGHIPFTILIPHYLPSGFEFVEMKESHQDERFTTIMNFRSQSASLHLTETKMSNNFDINVNVDAQEAQTEKIQVGRYQCNLITFTNGSCSLIWFTDENIKCELTGGINSEDAKKMALSMQ